MNKVKLLSVATLILFLSNLILLGFILKNKPEKRGDGPRNYIIEKLKFDNKQVILYDTLIATHRSEIRQSEHKIHALKRELYAGLNSSDKNLKDSIIKQIASTQIDIEAIHCKHFEDIKQICEPAQISAYNALLLELSDLFSPGMKPRK